MTIYLNPIGEQDTTEQTELADLMAELGSRTKAVEDTIAANMSDSAYLQALRAVQNTATRLVDQANRAK